MRFAQADDASTAQFEACLADIVQRLKSILISMRRADFGVVLFASVQVVIDAIDAT